MLVACAEAPRYGYEIATWLLAEGLVSAPVSPGRLYETLGTLSRTGALVGVDEESDKGPSRRRYHLTETGRELLAAWAVSLEHTAAILARLLSRMAALNGAVPGRTDHNPADHNPAEDDPAEGGEIMPCQCHCGGPGARNAESPTTATEPASAPQPAPARSVEERLEHVETLLERLVAR
ncbi:MAG: PadR family transcriptional regulator [Acidimicrobiales bacterium]